MAWLRAIALLDWDIVVFWCMVVSSLLFLLVLLAIVFFQEEQKSKCRRYNSQRATLHQLLGQKLLPIEPSLGWQLAGVFSNLRVWARHVPLPNGCSQTLHGCCAIVHAEAEDILAAVQNITKQREWDPTIASITQSSPPRLLDSLDGENPVMTDVVCIRPAVRSPTDELAWDGGVWLIRHALRGYWRRVSKILTFGTFCPDKETGNADVIINRIWKVEKDDSCWMFSRSDESKVPVQSTWCYVLIQPILESPTSSVVYLILSPSPESVQRPKDIGEQIAIHLSALRQYIKHTHLKLRPLTHTTLQHVSNLLPYVAEDEEEEESDDQATMQEGDAADEGSPRGSWVSGRRRGAAGEPPEAKTPRTKAEAPELTTTTTTKVRTARKGLSPSGRQKRTMPSRSKRNRVRAMGAAGAAGAAGGGAGADSDSSSSEDTGYSDWMSNKGSLERDGKAPGVVTSDPGVMSSVIDYMLCDEEPTSMNGGSEDLCTLANQCIAQLLGQSNQVAAINVNCSVAQQKAQTGGWFFHSLAKEVVILQKSPVQGKYHCFLGKGLIRAHPAEVFKAVKNPRTRFIYDNMLKKMDIIKEVDDNLQIVHAVHEVPQLLRKESRDFCVLQASKIEGSSHVVSFTSVNIAECQPSEAIARSLVLPSGWIIEPVGGDSKGPCSMVTYIVQVSIGSKGVPASFLHFLSRRVPLSVAYLRMFVEAETI